MILIGLQVTMHTLNKKKSPVFVELDPMHSMPSLTPFVKILKIWIISYKFFGLVPEIRIN